MVRCFVLHDVQSQCQHYAGQRKREIINKREDGLHGSDTDSGDIPETQVPEMQEEEDIYHVTVDDDTPRVNDAVQNPARRGQQRSRLNLQTNARRGSTSERLGQMSRPSTGGGSREDQRRQSFETTIQDTKARYIEFQRKSLQQLHPGSGPSYGIPHSGGLSSGSLSSVDNTTGGLWASNGQQWGTPPNAQQWGSFQASLQWGTPPTAQLWGTPPNAQQ
ncbi:unnamed protein product [Thlaspi arvense]|uniref:Uncharacterized protein n=1 Tax=Thlaspi arvense TaxID=13288 RepID=A0AAU9SQ31_THLAR|nr:unnamed protein product [Thlaspi arvense]